MIRRLLRYSLIILSALSLLACVATAWLWRQARSGAKDWVEIGAARMCVLVDSRREGVTVLVMRKWPGQGGMQARRVDPGGSDDERLGRPVVAWWWDRSRPAPVEWRTFGLRGSRGDITAFFHDDWRPLRWGDDSILWGPGVRTLPAWSIKDAPHWLIVAGTAILPLCWLLTATRGMVRRRRRRRLGLCLRCGYDLRESPGRCPECGAYPAEEKS